MKKKSADPFEPRIYFRSMSHPDFFLAEHAYITSHMFAGGSGGKWKRKQDTILACLEVPLEYRDAPEEFFLRQIVQGWGKRASEPRSFPEEKDLCVINAIRCFGQEALGPTFLLLRLPPEDWTTKQRRMYLLSLAIRKVVSYWQDQVKRGTLHRRRSAARRLTEIGAALTPETRGKRERDVVSPWLVKNFYYMMLFRLYQIQHALVAPGGHRSDKVKAASQNFEMPVEQIRELWCLDEADQPKWRSLSLRQNARRLTARQFGITEHTVSNIIASRV